MRSEGIVDAGTDARRYVAAAVDGLACWASELCWEDVPVAVAERLATVLFDVLAANVLGARTDAQQAIRTAWHYPPGNCPVVAGDCFTDAATAAFLNGQATVCLELDEGNKHARGHPAAHGFPAILALAAERDVSGRALARALLIGYEVAAKFGRATTPRAGAHPHGSWGIAGTAAGCAQLLGLDAGRTAAAIDAASGMPIAGHFDSALEGNPVRDSWIGAANHTGIAAARLAAAGAAMNTGTAAGSLGQLLGVFDAAALRAGPDERYEIEHNYFKQHTSCSYTHPIADLAIEARQTLFGGTVPPATVAEQVSEVHVSTHALATRLNRTTWHNPLSAMFSVPFVAAAALLEGKLSPEVTALRPDNAPLLAALASRVSIDEDVRMTRSLPGQRSARVTVRLTDGRCHTLETTNPVGDSDFAPFDRADLSAIFTGLLGPGAKVLDTLHAVVDGLDTGSGARSLLAPLASGHAEQVSEEQ